MPVCMAGIILNHSFLSSNIAHAQVLILLGTNFQKPNFVRLIMEKNSFKIIVLQSPGGMRVSDSVDLHFPVFYSYVVILCIHFINIGSLVWLLCALFYLF